MSRVRNSNNLMHGILLYCTSRVVACKKNFCTTAALQCEQIIGRGHVRMMVVVVVMVEMMVVLVQMIR